MKGTLRLRATTATAAGGGGGGWNGEDEDMGPIKGARQHAPLVPKPWEPQPHSKVRCMATCTATPTMPAACGPPCRSTSCSRRKQCRAT